METEKDDGEERSNTRSSNSNNNGSDGGISSSSSSSSSKDDIPSPPVIEERKKKIEYNHRNINYARDNLNKKKAPTSTYIEIDNRYNPVRNDIGIVNTRVLVPAVWTCVATRALSGPI